MSTRQYVFEESGVKRRSATVDTKYVRELKLLLRKQKRWMARIRRAMTALAKIDRQIKRLDAP